MAIKKRQYLDFTKLPPPTVSATNDGAGDQTVLACDAAGDEQVLAFANGVSLLMHNLGSAQASDVVPEMTAVGMDIGREQTSGDGLELITTILAAGGPSFVIGTDPAFYFKVQLKIADASGASNAFVGFRKVEAFQADEDDYADMAAIGCNGTANPNTIKLATILNGAATTSTDTTNTWADAATKTLGVHVSAAGVVTYTIDGAAPAATATFTFDTGDRVAPFVYFNHGADLAGTVELITWDLGYTNA